MGQKANTLTLRKKYQSFNLILFNKKLFLYLFLFLNNLKRIFFKKRILLLDITLNYINKYFYFNLQLFFTSKKLTNYKKKRKNFLKRKNGKRFLTFFFYRFNFIKKILSKGYFTIKKKSKKIYSKFKELKITFQKRMFHFFYPVLAKLRVNFMYFSLSVLNKKVNRKLIVFFFKKTRQFVSSLFSRQFNLFIDFIKLTTLLVQNKIKISEYLILLCSIFKIISKRSHNQFLIFLKYVFNLIILDLRPYKLKNSLKSHIIGIKFIIKGRIRAKLRASKYLIKQGIINSQKINLNLSYSSSKVHTMLGVFGFKFWISRS